MKSGEVTDYTRKTVGLLNYPLKDLSGITIDLHPELEAFGEWEDFGEHTYFISNVLKEQTKNLVTGQLVDIEISTTDISIPYEIKNPLSGEVISDPIFEKTEIVSISPSK